MAARAKGDARSIGRRVGARARHEVRRGGSVAPDGSIGEANEWIAAMLPAPTAAREEVDEAMRVDGGGDARRRRRRRRKERVDTEA